MRIHKLHILLAFLLVLLPLGMSAQREYSPNFAIGGKGGATLSRVSFNPEVHQKFTQGIIIGLKARYTEEKLFGLIGEINFVQRGWAEDFARDDAPDFTYKRTLTYIDIPLLTHIYFGSKTVKCFVNLGPEFGFNIGDKVSANFDYKHYEDVPNFPQGYRTNRQLAMDVENKFDYGITAGLGVEFLMKKKHSFMLEGRYYFGLGNIFGASKRDFFSASRNTSIEVSLSYMFRVK